ncbi:MAG: methylmalonyl-CoA mutase family protein, partial [Syntrophales bacterium]|nr:methylmalonyl-CoA mutase family protein [Syntrophales bacterium]
MKRVKSKAKPVAEKDEDKTRHTVSGIPIKPVYTAKDREKKLEKPGEYPFTRGLYPTMYRKTPWATLEVSGFGLPEETNARQKYLIEQGQLHYFGRPGIHLCFDLATQYGYDSDHPLVQYDVGKCGTIIDSLADMERVLDGLPIADMHISMINNPTGPILTAMLAAYAEKQGISWGQVSGSINNCSILGPISDNMITLPLRPTLRLMMDVVKFSTDEMPNLHPVTFHMYSCRERGANACQELAFGMAAGICVVEEGIKMGLEVDSFAPNLVFFFSLNNNFFEEIAKLRAARRLWAKIMKEKFGAKNPRSWKCQILSQTAGSTLTSQEPLNNIVRVAIQALAGVLGGVQAMHTCAYDEALDIPTEEAVRIAVKTQRIIEHETGAT